MHSWKSITWFAAAIYFAAAAWVHYTMPNPMDSKIAELDADLCLKAPQYMFLWLITTVMASPGILLIALTTGRSREPKITGDSASLP